MTEQADKARNPDQQLDIPQQIDADYGVAIERLDSWIDDGIQLLPNIILAILVMALFYGIGVFVRRLILRQSTRRNRDNLGEILGGLVK